MYVCGCCGCIEYMSGWLVGGGGGGREGGEEEGGVCMCVL